MFETCPRKSMILGIVFLVLLTIVVLILESHFASESLSHSNLTQGSRNFPTENNSTCWQHQEYSIVKECHPCTEFEIKSKSIGVCIHTHYKELLKCKNGEIVTRSCDKVAYLEEQAYWKFMGWTFFAGIASCTAVVFRQRTLNRKAMIRVSNQLANGLS